MFGPNTRNDAVMVDTIDTALMTAMYIPLFGENREGGTTGLSSGRANCIMARWCNLYQWSDWRITAEDGRSFRALLWVINTSSGLFDDLIPAERSTKPRENGITIATDPVGNFDGDLLEQSAEYVDVVEIGMSATILMEKSKLQKKITRYHELGIKVLPLTREIAELRATVARLRGAGPAT